MIFRKQTKIHTNYLRTYILFLLVFLCYDRCNKLSGVEGATVKAAVGFMEKPCDSYQHCLIGCASLVTVFNEPEFGKR